MKKLMSLAFAVLAALVGWAVVQNGGLKNLPNLGGMLSTPTSTSTTPPPPRQSDTIRIASWNIQVFGESKLQNAAAMEVIVRVLRNFDVVAIQEVRAQSQDILPHLVSLLNSDGKSHYDYVIGPRLGRSDSKEQYAYVFDLASVEVDRNQLYTLDDPDDLLHREPLVGWFRARGAPSQQAFTFSLVNVHTDPDEVDRELDILDDVFYAVRDDARKEDDVILLGDFNVNDKNLRQLGQVGGLVWVIANTPTNTRRTAQYDNIFFQRTATPEFSGRGGVYDYLREYNLSLEQALQISDHLPIWAEFSVVEGGQGGPLAAKP